MAYCKFASLALVSTAVVCLALVLLSAPQSAAASQPGQLYKAAEYCCVGCSYASSCCCPPRIKKPVTITVFKATKTKTVLRNSNTATKVPAPRSFDGSVAGPLPLAENEPTSRALYARHLCPTCPSTASLSKNSGVSGEYIYCCPRRATVTKTLQRTLTKTVVGKATAVLRGRAFYDNNKNSIFDASIDAPIAFQLLHVVSRQKVVLGSGRSNGLGMFRISYNLDKTPGATAVDLVKDGAFDQPLISVPNGATNGDAPIIRPPKPSVILPMLVSANVATIKGVGTPKRAGTPTMVASLICRGVAKSRAFASRCGNATVSATGAFEVNSSRLRSGTTNITVIQINAQGAESDEILAGLATILAPPLILTAIDNGDKTIDVEGTGSAGAVLKLYEGQSLLETTTVGTDNTWMIAKKSVPSGEHNLRATQEDSAGVSDPSQPKSVVVGNPTTTFTKAFKSITAALTARTTTTTSQSVTHLSTTAILPTSSLSQTTKTQSTSATRTRTTSSRTNMPRWPVVRWGVSTYNYNSLYGFALDSQGNSYAGGDGRSGAVVSPINQTMGYDGAYLVKLDSWGYYVWSVAPFAYVLDITLSSTDEVVYVGTNQNKVGAYLASNGTLLWMVGPSPYKSKAIATDTTDDGLICAGYVNGGAGSFSILGTTVPYASGESPPAIFKIHANGTLAWVKIFSGGSGAFGALYFDSVTQIVYGSGQASSPWLMLDGFNVTNPGYPSTGAPDIGCPFTVAFNAANGTLLGLGFAGCPTNGYTEVRAVTYHNGMVYYSGYTGHDMTGQVQNFTMGPCQGESNVLCGFLGQMSASTWAPQRYWNVNPSNYLMVDALTISKTTGTIALLSFRVPVANSNFTVGNITTPCYNVAGSTAAAVATFDATNLVFTGASCMSSPDPSSRTSFGTVVMDANDNIFVPGSFKGALEISTDPNHTLYATPVTCATCLFSTIVKFKSNLLPSYN